MVIATEETRLLGPSSSSSALHAGGGTASTVVDIDIEDQHSIQKSNTYNNDNANPAFKLNSIVVTKIISYSAVAISIILGILLVVTTIENTIRYDNNTSLGNSISSLSWFSSSYYHHDDDDNDWGHFHKWKKDNDDKHKWRDAIDIDDNSTASDHYHSSSYEYDSDGTKNGTKHIHTDYEKWTIHNTNGTVTHYESWIDKDGIHHTTSYTTSD